jgi:oligoribonuclease
MSLTDDTPALLWVDVETTGLIPRESQILELGLRITDERLTTLSEASWVVRFNRSDLSNLSDFILKMHTKNGLIFECMESAMSMADVEDAAVRWAISRLSVARFRLADALPDEPPPMAGSTVGFDRAMLREHMPAVDALAHYRSFDVSTIKLAARLWYPSLSHWEGGGAHRVLPDISESVNELRWYIESGIIKGPYGIIKGPHA